MCVCVWNVGETPASLCVCVYKVDCTRFLDKAFQGHQRKNDETYPKKKKKRSTNRKNAGDSSSRMKNLDPSSLSLTARMAFNWKLWTALFNATHLTKLYKYINQNKIYVCAATLCIQIWQKNKNENNAEEAPLHTTIIWIPRQWETPAFGSPVLQICSLFTNY